MYMSIRIKCKNMEARAKSYESAQGFTSASDSSSDGTVDETITERFSAHLTTGLFVLVLLLAATVAYSAGIIFRSVLMHPLMHPSAPNRIKITSMKNQEHLPTVTTKAASTTKILHHLSDVTTNTVHLSTPKDVATISKTIAGISDKDDHEDDQELAENSSEGLHLPAGQHLLIDMINVDSTFLNSEQRLSEAIIKLIDEIKLTLLSYHCHSIVPMGVRCAGILLESHIALHTWPQEGVMSLDLFTCGSMPLIPFLPMIEKMFAIPIAKGMTGGPAPKMLWSHKLRGFRSLGHGYKRQENPLDNELGEDIVRKHFLDMKVPLVSDETDFQNVDIYKFIDPQSRSFASYEQSLMDDGSYESINRQLYQPDKILYLDGVHQSTLRGDSPYHEALVHPSMIAHSNPKRVAIIGGGEGATLREVLKHKTIDEVRMVEIDGELVELCKEHLPEMSNCTDIDGSDADSCFDDSRANVVFEDAFAYFIDSFGKSDENEDQKFDVIIMDALDPDKFVEIVGALYKNDDFVGSLFKGLTDEGVFVVQMGQTDDRDDPATEVGPDMDTAQMMDALQNAGFTSMLIYDEGHSKFFAPWAYLVCFKTPQGKARWYRSAAEIEVELHNRILKTKSGLPPLKYFDGSSMQEYQRPSKATVQTFCRTEGRGCGTSKVMTESIIYNPYFDRHTRKDGAALGNSIKLMEKSRRAIKA